MWKLVTILVFSALSIQCVKAPSKNNSTLKNSSLEKAKIEKNIQDILKKMTLKEKAGQMMNIGLPSLLSGDYWDSRDTVIFDAVRFKKYIISYGIGSIHNTPGYPLNKEEWYKVVKTIQEAAIKKTRLGIPTLYGIDNIHGANYVNGSVMFPQELALAATWNTRLIKKTAEITSYESRSASLPWNFNPNADVAMNPIWGRIGESFGEDPYLISEMTKAYIEGSQANGLQDTTSTAVCLKHFLGYGAGRNGKDRSNALIPERSLRQYYLPPFKKAIDNGAMAVMISSNAVNGIPCIINKYYITNILKGEIGFKGVVISDFDDIAFLVKGHQSARNLREATKKAVNAGLDLIMNPYDAKVVDLIIDLVKNHEISESRINDAVTRILRLKFYLNLFKVPYNNPSNYTEFASKSHIETNYKAATEAITLLKNEQYTLPLNKNKKFLITGYASNSMNILNGAWSRSFLGRDTAFTDKNKLTILQAIKKQVGVKNVVYVQGTGYKKDLNTDLAIAEAKNVDYIIACVGEIPSTEKPSDINELQLPKAQQELIIKLAKTKKPIILVMVQSRPRIIREIEPLVKSVIMAYLPGQEGGRAIADILFGKINPSGKLPFTYPKYSGNYVTYYHKKTDIRDVSWKYNGFYPQYEFGYGLSYTMYEYSNLRISTDTLIANKVLKLKIDVKNIGSLRGKEIVEVYSKDMVATVSPDSKKLIRFTKIMLNPGETKTLSFNISSSDIASVGLKNKWITENGDFKIFIGGDPQKMLKREFYYHN
ncbi:MAG: glycoside hydrolase family 3 C-terminal domain-containing protein [Flavobacteriaceae bacterium]|nr:glycoside hydrolase family 3 C-terminal domain-containing protein [Flavobacteriaceae bacterium]